MGTYRLSRNLESSLIDYLQTELEEDNWKEIICQKSLKREEILPPTIAVSIESTDTQKREIGGRKFIKFPVVTLRIFATGDGQREDLADWILEQLEADDIDYYHYNILNGKVTSKTLAGNIVIVKILRNEKELANTNPDTLEKEDRYRHMIQFKCFVGKV